MSIRSISFAAVAAALALVLAAGCTVQAQDSSPYANCTQDPSLACVAGADGWRCAVGTNPEQEVANVSCSNPQPDGPDDDFCCFAWTYGSSCRPDDTLQCAPFSYGYVCTAGDNPQTLDSALNCSSPTPDGPNDDFCCQ
jgi:hypothetical protein